jgi:acetyl esterase/lipase
MNSKKRFLVSLVVLVGLVAACSASPQEETTSSTFAPTSTPAPTNTPTSTPVPTPEEEPDVVVNSNVPYVEGGDRKQKLNIYLPPQAEGPLPTLLAFRGLNLEGSGACIPMSDIHPVSLQTHESLARYFAERGYAVVLVNHRFPSEPFQMHVIRDAFCSLAWVHANGEEYGFDPQRIAVFGERYGAMVAAMLGTVDDPSVLMEGCPHTLPESDWVKGVVTYEGLFFTPEGCSSVGLYTTLLVNSNRMASQVPYKEMEDILQRLQDLPPQDWRSSAELDERDKEIAQMLPQYWVDGSEPPFLLVHGLKDECVLASESETLGSELQAAGVKAELLLLPDASFSSLMDEESSQDILEAMEAFLDDLLGTVQQ